ncbi:MAG: hypothetical protein Q9219_007316 [cf. Caloplaca sp. 3 TL-2023]
MSSKSKDCVVPKQKQSVSSKALQKQYDKQKQRRIPRDTLPSPTLNIPLDDYTSFATCLKHSTRILALLGAGLSAASGIPTFRGPGGFWREHDATKLATPEAFEKDPSLIWQFYSYRRHAALKASPNRAHVALAKLAEKKSFLAINQNIDGDPHPMFLARMLQSDAENLILGLSQRAQHSTSSLLPIHGSLFDIKCSNPQCSYISVDDSTDPIVPSLSISEEHDISNPRFPISSIPVSSLPHCPQCASLLRPAVVWFGEQVPFSAREQIHTWLDKGPVDLMLVIGTSATVWPASIYIHCARLAGARIAVFNTEEANPELDDESQKLTQRDWFFKGDAAAVIPDVLKEVIGLIPQTKH